MEKRKRKELNLKEKVKLIHESEKEGKSQRKLAEIYGIGKTQVHNVKKE
jgi:DNA invertase Pin-like site-specific DNA recombinase